MRLKSAQLDFLKLLQSNKIVFNLGGSISLVVYDIIERSIHDLDIIIFNRNDLEKLKGIVNKFPLALYPANKEDTIYHGYFNNPDCPITVILVENNIETGKLQEIRSLDGAKVRVNVSHPGYAIIAKLNYLKDKIVYGNTVNLDWLKKHMDDCNKFFEVSLKDPSKTFVKNLFI